MNIGILGSSFDPPHNGHIAVVKNVLKSQKIDRAILMPVNIHPFAKKITSAVHRLTMTSLLERKNIGVSDLETKRNSISYSIDTLKALQEKSPKDKFYWIIGSDYLESFTKWKDWQEIINGFGLIIVARDIHADITNTVKKIIGNNSMKNILILNAKDFPPLDISSSEIRERVKKGKTINDLVPKAVENYIIRHKLYL